METNANGDADDVVKRNGTAVPCFVTTLLDDASAKTPSKDSAADSQRDFDIRWTANSMYSASIDTVRLFLPMGSCSSVSCE